MPPSEAGSGWPVVRVGSIPTASSAFSEHAKGPARTPGLRKGDRAPPAWGPNGYGSPVRRADPAGRAEPAGRAPTRDPGGAADAGREPAGFDGEAYQARFDALAARGLDVHGEAAFVLRFEPASVLDAGCGTGRIAIELARQGVEVVGVDVDPSMLAEAARRGPAIPWVESDLATVDLGRTFDVVVLAGNVPIFCPGASRAGLVPSCAAHVAPAGVLVAGFQLGRGYPLEEWDEACAAAGLRLEERWSTWDREPFEPAAGYAVSVHRHHRG